MKNKLLKFLFIFLIFLTSFNLVFSQFYADLTIDVNSFGDVSINGKTNYNNFLNISNSAKFTSKKSNIWTLNISSNKNEIFDDFIYELILPQNSQILYMKTTPNFRIENLENRIKIIGIGKNKPFTIIVQYKTTNFNLFSNNNYLFWLIGFAFLIFLLIIIYFGYKLLNKETNFEKEIEDIIEESDLINPEHKLKFKKYDISNFPKRQQEIINLLKKNGDSTQDELREIMKIPKSSISRNIKSLEIKKIVEIRDFGRYNKIKLNKKRIEEI